MNETVKDKRNVNEGEIFYTKIVKGRRMINFSVRKLRNQNDKKFLVIGENQFAAANNTEEENKQTQDRNNNKAIKIRIYPEMFDDFFNQLLEIKNKYFINKEEE